MKEERTFNLEISEELLNVLQDERAIFTKEIGVDFTLEQTLWEWKKLLNAKREVKK